MCDATELGDSLADLQRTLEEILGELNRLSAEDSAAPSVDGGIGYESRLEMRGLPPVLPPLMTPERREQCLIWKKEAMQVEERLKRNQQRSHGGPAARDQINQVLNHNQSVVKQEAGQQEELCSEAGAPARLVRSASYTLIEPSAELAAIMSQSGRQLPSASPPPASVSDNDVLQQYLVKLSRPPPLTARRRYPSSEAEQSLAPAVVADPLPSTLQASSPTGSEQKELAAAAAVTDSSTATLTTGTQPDARLASVQLEEAISSLAIRQNQEIQRLLEQQDRERERLKRLFEAQQRQLIDQILGQLAPGPVNHQVAPLPKQPSANLLTNELKLRLHRLPAMVKGYLTRRLLRTDRVQSIIRSMKDAMTIALQLHRETKSLIKGSAATTTASSNVSVQDLELHRRLLQKLFKDARAIHDIFFALSPAERMSIINQDRQLRQQRNFNARATASNCPDHEKRLSAVTKAKIQQRKQIQAMLIKSNGLSKSKSPQVQPLERPWRSRFRSEPAAQVRVVGIGARRSPNENRKVPLSRDKTVALTSRLSSPGHAFSVIHNKAWK